MRLRFLFALLTIFLGACENKAVITAHFITQQNKTPEFNLNVAKTPKVRAMGLMHVREMPANEGMIFAFPKEEKQSFWMKNTYIPLDLIFINSKLKIVGILENVPILNEVSRAVDADSTYVIELIAGSCKKYGIKTGDQVVLSEELKASY